jgi:hypothetical protein
MSTSLLCVTRQLPQYALVLNPKDKLSHFKRHWPQDLMKDVLKCVEDVVSYSIYQRYCNGTMYDSFSLFQFKERYLQLSDNTSMKASSQSKTSHKGLRILLHELSDDEDIAADAHSGTPEDPDRPWAQHFNAYMDTIENIPEGWSAIKWWGVSHLLVAL